MNASTASPGRPAHAAAIESAVSRFLLERQRAEGLTPGLGDNTAVFDNGLIDSLTLIDLVAAVEAQASVEVDMLRFDPSAVGTLAELVTQLVDAAELADVV